MRATISIGKGLDFRSQEVEINNISEMTPKNAIAFRNVAFGVGASVNVVGGGKAYRVSGIGAAAKARRIKL